ncbi:MAG: 30S ribosomal protein S16 [Planctomycetaceae bacterium]|jgi:small subunit ribosomal protein S16|nr:30S ribosomal protein S16 [Planctomycetaceae bacterium]
MAVKIRMKKFGRLHRPFFRVCVTDARSPRDGRVIEEVGYYDPMVPETDARAVLNGERIAYWLGVGAQPSEKVAVLIKKYGTNGTHVDAQKSALDQLAVKRRRPDIPDPATLPKPEPKQKRQKKEKAEKVPEVAEAAPAVGEAPVAEAAAPAVEAAPAAE